MDKKFLLLISLVVVFSLITFDSFAQGGFGNLDGIDFPDDVNDEPVPIFGHLLMMLSIVIGSLLGYKKLKK